MGGIRDVTAEGLVARLESGDVLTNPRASLVERAREVRDFVAALHQGRRIASGRIAFGFVRSPDQAREPVDSSDDRPGGEDRDDDRQERHQERGEQRPTENLRALNARPPDHDDRAGPVTPRHARRNQTHARVPRGRLAGFGCAAGEGLGEAGRKRRSRGVFRLELGVIRIVRELRSAPLHLPLDAPHASLETLSTMFRPPRVAGATRAPTLPRPRRRHSHRPKLGRSFAHRPLARDHALADELGGLLFERVPLRAYLKERHHDRKRDDRNRQRQGEPRLEPQLHSAIFDANR